MGARSQVPYYCSSVFKVPPAILLIVIKKTTPIAENRELFILGSHPLRVHFSSVYYSSPAKRLVDVKLDLYSKVTASAFSNGGSINLFDYAQGFVDSFSVGFIHLAKGKVMNLDLERSPIKM